MIKKIFLVAAIIEMLFISGAGAVDLLAWNLGARPMGLGSSFTAVPGAVESINWNPAGLAFMSKAGLISGYASSFGEVSHYYLGGAVPVWSGVLGGCVTYAGLSSLPLTSVGPDGRPLIEGYYSDTQLLLGLSYSQEVLLKGLSVGGTVKGYQHKIYQSSTKGFGLDLGVLYDLSQSGLLPQTLPVTVALTAKNVLQPKLNWPTGWTDTPGRRLILGAAYQGKILDNNFLVSVDANVLGGSKKTFGLGVEYCLIPMLPIRLGYGNDQLGAGVGLRFSDWGIDMGYQNNPDLGGKVQISLSWLPDFTLSSRTMPTPSVVAETPASPEVPVIAESRALVPVESSVPEVPVAATAPEVAGPAPFQPLTAEELINKVTVLKNGAVTKVFVQLNPGQDKAKVITFVADNGQMISLTKLNVCYWGGASERLNKFTTGKVYLQLYNGSLIYQRMAIN